MCELASYSNSHDFNMQQQQQCNRTLQTSNTKATHSYYRFTVIGSQVRSAFQQKITNKKHTDLKL